MSVPTPHNRAKMGEIAPTVIMPGDPLRARFIAENYLEDAKCFNDVKGMLGFTGYYKGVRVSTMGHGMVCLRWESIPMNFITSMVWKTSSGSDQQVELGMM